MPGCRARTGAGQVEADPPITYLTRTPGTKRAPCTHAVLPDFSVLALAADDWPAGFWPSGLAAALVAPGPDFGLPIPCVQGD